MNTVSVWVLVFYISGYSAGGPSVIDNIATLQECQRVAGLLPKNSEDRTRCIEVLKTR